MKKGKLLQRKPKGKRQHITPYKRIRMGIDEAIKDFRLSKLKAKE